MRQLAFALFALLAACVSGDGPVPARQVAPILAEAEARDWHSFARPEVARVTHVALDLALDFESRRIGGTATLDIQAADGAQEIVLDSRGLEISAVTDATGQALPFQIGEGDAIRGRPVSVRMGAARQIRIAYRSAPDAAALQWLTPQQTAGGQNPYLFSQGQAILNRTWIPTQDSPGIRQTWEARITAPTPLTVVMSGDRLTPRGEPAENGRRAFRFRMDHPVPSYAIAIAAGDIAFRSLGRRTGVWTEPAMLERAAAELVDTERMVEAAERLYGPYRWGRYDLLVLPPSFPYGGMENPTLTFLTPTFIAGDRSLVGLVAHELAHSWSGNLVTNAAWGDSWLNEGVTSYFENRIMEALYGRERAAQEAALSWDSMQRDMAEIGATADGTRLHVPVEGQDPDSFGVTIAYDKGALFLRTLETMLGRERWDAYLRAYFDRHAFQPMTSARFLADLRQHLVRDDAAVEARLGLQEWIYGTGVPANAARPDPRAFAGIDAALAAFNAGGAPPAAYANWTTAERLRFIDALPRRLDSARLAALDDALRLSQSGNAEVLFAWLRLGLANRYEPAVAPTERFLSTMGRRKFVVPLFQALMAQGDWGRPIARRIYERVRPTWHPVTGNSVDALMRG